MRQEFRFFTVQCLYNEHITYRYCKRLCKKLIYTHIATSTCVLPMYPYSYWTFDHTMLLIASTLAKETKVYGMNTPSSLLNQRLEQTQYYKFSCVCVFFSLMIFNINLKVTNFYTIYSPSHNSAFHVYTS